jgi:hypothetical protein
LLCQNDNRQIDHQDVSCAMPGFGTFLPFPTSAGNGILRHKRSFRRALRRGSGAARELNFTSQTTAKNIIARSSRIIAKMFEACLEPSRFIAALDDAH